MVNDSAAATQNGIFANAKSLSTAQLDDSFVARSFDLRLAGDAIEVVATDGNVEFAYDNTDINIRCPVLGLTAKKYLWIFLVKL